MNTAKTILAAGILFSSLHIHAQSWSTIGNGGTNSATNFLGTTNNQSLTIRTNNTERMRIDSTGNVGIGIALPTAKLHIATTTNQYGVTIDNQRVGVQNTTALNIVSRNTGTGGAYGADITSVGAGGGDNIALKLYAQDGTTNYGILTSALSNSGQTAYGIYASSIGAGTNYAGYFVGRSYFSDNVGIGSLPTGAKLTVYSTDVNNAAFMVKINTIPRFKVYGNGGVSIGVDNSLTPAAGLYVAGNVNIGAVTGGTGYKLSVGGKIICEELKVELAANWPDYVFDESYKLMSIDELANHLKTNKHLPGIPAACEMESNGLAVGAMQTKLVEKVEELSLYIIQLKKEIDLLKAAK